MYTSTHSEPWQQRGHRHHGHREHGGGQPQERRSDPPLATEKVNHERKIFFIDLKENQRGRMFKITEDVGGRRDTILLPAEAAKEFIEALQRLVEFEGRL